MSVTVNDKSRGKDSLAESLLEIIIVGEEKSFEQSVGRRFPSAQLCRHS